MEKNEIVITHETLFEIVKREKDRTELQKLDTSFFANVVDYIKEKRKIVSGNDSLFSFDDKRKTEKQIETIRRLLKDLYDKREKKIINMALDKSRTKSDVIDTSALLKEERVLFDHLVGLFDKSRAGILYSLLNESIPVIEKYNENSNEVKKAGDDEEKEIIENKAKNEIEKNTKMVRFVHAVPKFVGEELEEYGPFEEDDVANLPSEIADVLILKSRVEEIKEESMNSKS